MEWCNGFLERQAMRSVQKAEIQRRSNHFPLQERLAPVPAIQDMIYSSLEFDACFAGHAQGPIRPPRTCRSPSEMHRPRSCALCRSLHVRAASPTTTDLVSIVGIREKYLWFTHHWFSGLSEPAAGISKTESGTSMRLTVSSRKAASASRVRQLRSSRARPTIARNS